VQALDQLVGTTKELIAIFIRAFGLDRPVAKATEAGKALKLGSGGLSAILIA
jgi:hypothetical protein